MKKKYKYYRKQFYLYFGLIMLGLLISLVSLASIIILLRKNINIIWLYGILAGMISFGAIVSLLFLPKVIGISNFYVKEKNGKLIISFSRYLLILEDYDLQGDTLLYKETKVNLNSPSEVIDFLTLYKDDKILKKAKNK